MLINRSIPNLFNGVSQQPASLRHVTQCEVMENAFASIATGTRKRPPTQHIKRLTATLGVDAFVHVINIGSGSRYLILSRTNTLEVYDLTTGVAQTVLTPDGTAQLNIANSRDGLRALTVADYTFIAGKDVTVAFNAAVTPGTVLGSKQTFSALPAGAAAGDIWRVEGTPDSSFDDYYVRWDGSVWVEHVQPGNTDSLDALTMPFQLIKTGPTEFTYAKATWASRLVGDPSSAPAPSFIGRKIKDIFFHRNRLGFIADEGFVMSRAGEPFGFWSETATAILDTDPIDASVSHTEVSLLHSAVNFDKALLMFSDSAQFQLSAGDLLTPKTGRADLATAYQSSPLCHPVSSGQALFSSVDRGVSSGIREYYVDSSVVSNDPTDITEHVPSYIPKNVFKMAPCTSEDALFVASLERRNELFIYKYFWSNNNKVQSAWGKFVFPETDTIISCEVVNNDLHLVIQRADGVHLERMSLASSASDSDVGFLVHLDSRTSLTGTYDAVNEWTTWVLPYSDSAPHEVILGGGFPTSDRGNNLLTTRPSSTTVRALGDWSAAACYVGKNYTMRYRFSEQFVRDGKDVSITTARLKMRRMTVAYANTGYFRAEVTPLGRSTYTYEFTGHTVGLTVLGESAISTGSFKFPVSAGTSGLKIDIISDSYLPCSLQSAEWDGEFTLMATRQ